MAEMFYIPSMDVLAIWVPGPFVIVRLNQGNYVRVVPTLLGSFAVGLVI